MVQQLPGISVVKSPCAAWEGRLGKGSGGFCAGEAGGGAGAAQGAGAWAQRCQPGSELGTVQPRRLAGSWLSAPAQPSPSAQHLCTLPFSPRKMVECKVTSQSTKPENGAPLPFGSAAELGCAGRWGEGPQPLSPSPGGRRASRSPSVAAHRAPRRGRCTPRAWRHGPCSLARSLRESRQGSWRVAEAAMPIPLFITASYTNKIFTSLP